MKDKVDYDVIVIGSGIGGATPAILLAKYFNKKVLVLEKHWKFGGLTHGFELDGKIFSPGVHYIGGVNNGSVPDRIFDIITGGSLRWLPMPFRYDSFHFPYFKYAFPSSADLMIKELSDKFPDDAEAIKRFVRHSRKAFRFMVYYTSIRSFAPKTLHGLIPLIRLFLGFDPNSSLMGYLDKRFKNQELKNLFSVQWMDHGVRPNEASFMVHSMIFNHYLDGAFYPENGPESLNQGIADCLEQNGIDLKISTEAVQILTKGNRAYGVKVKDANGNESYITGNHIISDAGALSTYKDLLAHHEFQFLKEASAHLTPKYTFFNIYVSLNDSPQRLGFDGSNQWIIRTEETGKNSLPPSHPLFPEQYCITFPSLKANDPVNHKVEIMTMVDYAIFRPWKDEGWKKRDHSYYNLKERITSAILRDIEKRYPGFMKMVEACDSSSPLTMEKFTSREKGAAYGVPFSVYRMQMKWLSNRTPIKNLYLAGQDSLGPGIMGAMMGGVGAAAKVLGPFGYFRIMGHVTKHAQKEKTQYYSTVVRSVTRETLDSYTITFEPSDHIDNKYEAGQFILVNAMIKGKNVKRSYSLSSSPNERYASITLKKTKNGLMSNFLSENVNAGDSMQVSAPRGRFFVPKKQRGHDMVFIAAGSGITPLFSILKDILENQDGNKIHLVYANKTPEKTIFKSQIENLVKSYSQDFKVTYFFSENDRSSSERLGHDSLRHILNGNNPKNTLVYVCAPEGITYMVWEILRQLDFNPDNFKYESFSTKGLNIHKVDIPSVDSKVTYRTRKDSYKAVLDKESTLLEGLIEKKVPMEYSCMNGDCGLCRCKVMEGEVLSLLEKSVKRYGAGDTILPCISYSGTEILGLEKQN